MNSLNDWCRMASLVCCLLLGIEGVSFVHDIATQARTIKSEAAGIEMTTSVPSQETHRSEVAPASAKVAVN